MHKGENKMSADQIYQDFQSQPGDIPQKKVSKLEIEQWIAAL
jgi:hypothetical protein